MVDVASGDFVQFSFLAFNTPRTTIFVHAQLVLVYVGGRRRRLQIISSNDFEASGSNQIRHFIDSSIASEVNDQDTHNNHKETPRSVVQNEESEWNNRLSMTHWIIIGVIIMTCCCITSLIIIVKKKSEKSKIETELPMKGVVMATSTSTSSVGTATPVTCETKKVYTPVSHDENGAFQVEINYN